MADQLTHPADRAVHAVNNAIQILIGIQQCNVLQPAKMDASDARRLLEGVTADIQALQDFSRAQSAELLELREQGLHDAQCINRLEALNTKLTQEAAESRRLVADAQGASEDLVRDLAPILEEVTAAFNFANRIRASLVAVRTPAGVTTTEAPRVAAAGGQ